jgi:transcriptional regulator with XRE-family HTH domain
MKETIGNKIRIQRLTKNYSQEYMAFMLDMTQSAYSKIERDATILSIPRIYAIAEILEISPFILLPPPKFGIGIDHHWFLRTIHKIKNIWTGNFKKKRAEADKLDIVYNDKSKALND